MKTFLLRSWKTLIALAILAFLINASWYNYLFKGVYATYLQGHTSGHIFDAAAFELGTVEAPEIAQPWAEALDIRWAPSSELQGMLDDTETGAFLVIHKDSVRYEDYDNRVRRDTRTNSFSMAKSITTMMVQVAIERGEIPSWETPVKTYFPELKGPGADRVTLADLAGMTTDMDWNENYSNPFGITAKAVYGRDMRATILNLDIGDNVGQVYEYQSGATSLLGMCLQEATEMLPHEYASEVFWKHMGAEYDAEMHMDDEGQALCFTGFNATARDFARFGKLVLHDGRYDSLQLVHPEFFRVATEPSLSQHYGRSFWLDVVNLPGGDAQKIVALRGFLGQFIIVMPGRDLIIVRTGHDEGPRDGNGLPALFNTMCRDYASRVSS